MYHIPMYNYKYLLTRNDPLSCKYASNHLPHNPTYINLLSFYISLYIYLCNDREVCFYFLETPVVVKPFPTLQDPLSGLATFCYVE